MRQIKRFTAFLLCLLMILPTQELTVLAETMSAEHVQIEEMLSTEPMEDGSGSIEETQESEKSEESENAGKTLSSETSGTSEDGADRIKETLPLEPVEDGADRIKETLPLEPVEDGADRIKETLPLEPVEDGTDRIKETLPLEVIKTGIDHIKKTLQLEPLEEDGYAIYWNPGDQLPIELATASKASSTAISNTSLTATSKASSKVSSTASDATSSNAVSSMPPKGRDTANGLSPAKPVKTLAKALERAKKLMKKKGLEPSDITIYAMNPMEIADGELYALNAGNIRIASWPDRPYENDALFYVNGGQLTLMNVQLEAEEPDREPDETELVYVRGGVLQMGQNVNINGRVIMDYRSDEEDTRWKKSASTSSDATKAKGKAEGESGREGKENKAGSNISKYNIDPGEENIKLLKEKKSASTWREPIIELMDGFNGGIGEYYLEVKAADGDAESRELVTTLYTDDTTEEEFLSYFSLAESEDWNLQVEAASTVQLRDTGAKSTESEENLLFRSFDLEEELLTSKTLFASRSLTTMKPIYWNPGPEFIYSGTTYHEGSDTNDGTVATAPVKTWNKAVSEARNVNGIVVAIRSLNLGAAGAENYLEKNEDDEFYISSPNSQKPTPLATWSVSGQPAIIVPENQTLVVENLVLEGRYGSSGANGNITDAPTIQVDKGDLIIKGNVGTSENGYIQMTAFPGIEDHPVYVCSTEEAEDGEIRLFFSGINESIEYRYKDVVVPGGDLKKELEEIQDPEERSDMEDLMGKKLLKRLKLHDANKSPVSGGQSKFEWILRQDTGEDDSLVKSQNIELYTEYYFEAIYLDGVNGDDGNYGATCAYPVKTWGMAKQIWEEQMEKSRVARQKAIDEGATSSEELEQVADDYPMPEVIYICDTVTVTGNEQWSLEQQYDPVRASDITTEVRSHIDEYKSGTLRHEDPRTMIEVKGASGNLEIKDVFIRNMTDETDSVTVKVVDGGKLTVSGNSVLNGTRMDRHDNAVLKTLTLGNHVTITENSTFVMSAAWDGSIEYKEQGVVADGNGAAVEMYGGSIQKNNSYRADYYSAGRTDHKAGGGVALSGGATFTMNGGRITGNQAYRYGAGVYLKDDSNTSFIMKKGEISDNCFTVSRVSQTNSGYMASYGAGIYAGKETTVSIGDEHSKPEDTSISGNKGRYTWGSGIYAAGVLNVMNAAVSNNESGGSDVNLQQSAGVGICIGSNGTLTMDRALVKGNHGIFSAFGEVKGAGIYFANSSKTHTITESTITGNETGYEYSAADASQRYSQGGGIYIDANNTLRITDTEISDNRAATGGGIYATGSTLTLNNTVIEKNAGELFRDKRFGNAGGIYFKDGTLTLENGIKIKDNTAIQEAAGIYIEGTSTKVNMKGTAQEPIIISGNKILGIEYGGNGGGVNHKEGSWSAEYVEIYDNVAKGMGGGIYAAGGNNAYFRNVSVYENQANTGAGLAMSNSSNYYLQDCTIESNTATDTGGGIYLHAATVNLHLSEKTPGAFKLEKNHAEHTGGGITVADGTLVMDIAGPIQNRADKQGSNLYLNGTGNLSILNGEFKQPTAPVVDVYNFYVNDTSTTVHAKYFDFSKVTIERKPGAAPDAILLNSGNSFLTVLVPPPDDTFGSLPIDLNIKEFKSGSVVLKPAGSLAGGGIIVSVPDSALTNKTNVTKPYGNITDASTNLDYYKGGKIPRRSMLGGYKDGIDSTKKNVVVIGEGVYLDGAGLDTNGGTSPDDAVATFGRAKDILEERINKTFEDESERGLSENEREGFAPIIYICGQVTINENDNSWILDYDDQLFTETNKYYAMAEARYNEPVYEPQICRFASFTTKPLIRVDSNNNNLVTFTVGKLIIDGMADKVVLDDQRDRSPVIYGGKNTHVVLTGNSKIRNNYFNVLKIYGELTLEGEVDEENRQLYNNQAKYMVNLYEKAKMTMKGYARIITDNTVNRVSASIVGSGIYVGDDVQTANKTSSLDVSIFMEGNAQIVLEQGSMLMSSSLIYSESAKTTIEMKGNSRIEAGNSINNAVFLFGVDSALKMSDHASIATVGNGYWQNGVELQKNNSLTMSDWANITYEGKRVNSGASNVKLTSGSVSQTASVKMQDEAAIVCKGTGTVYRYGIYPNGVSSKIELLNNAKIVGDGSSGTYGIYGNSSSAGNLTISMNMEPDGEPDESASIMKVQYGIYLHSRDISVSLGKMAQIACDNVSGNTSYGIYMNQCTGTTDILLTDESKINKASYGIYFDTINSDPINIRLEKEAAIEQNTVGIAESMATGNSSYGTHKLNVEMFGKARISGNSNLGIQLVSIGNYRNPDDYQKITLHDDAIIGGDTYYDTASPRSGNRGPGIYTTSPIEVTMYDRSKIAGNGGDYGKKDVMGAGIYLNRNSTAGTYREGTAKVVLNDSASVCDNKSYSIYAQSISNSAGTVHNDVLIELNGVAGGTLSAPSIKGNGDALYLGTDTTLKLIGEARVEIGSDPYQSGTYVARAIDNYGKVELDGRSTVTGLIYMNNSDNPITMTHAAAGTEPKYDLHLVEGFTGKIVVKPDNVVIMDLTAPPSQLLYFHKVSGDGMAADRPLMEESPNLVLRGENNVYLSGIGSDSNTGNTPTTAVRTFKRARQLLEGAGYYESGANIIVCSSVVTVKAGDENWAFEPGGFVTNTKSGNRWQPLVIRQDGYDGVLINIPDLIVNNKDYADTVTFENITIDGGSENGIVLETWNSKESQLLTVGTGKTAILGEGAVLQNNKALCHSAIGTASKPALGVMVYSGTLEINGGIIRNIVREEAADSSISTNSTLASAVFVGGTSSRPGSLIMKSGQIIDNELNAPQVSGSIYMGTMAFGPLYSKMELSGGLIADNKVVSSGSNPASAGAIVLNNSPATISGGVIRGNEGGYGSAIFYNGASTTLTISGGQISGNRTNVPGKQSVDSYAPIYVRSNGITLHSNGANISDGIYIERTTGMFNVSGDFYQAGRSYRVYLNQGTGSSQFRKGSIVVRPDGNNVVDATPYLSNFDVRTNPYVLDRGRSETAVGTLSGVKENQCLLLMQAIYLDSKDGLDTNTGRKPSQAVKTFAKAKQLGEAATYGSSKHYVIYICGAPATSTSGEGGRWTLPETAYLCRYTGFPVYEEDGEDTPELEWAYHGYLIEPTSDLTFQDITVQGRRGIDSESSNGNSLVKIRSGIKVTVESGAVFSGNYNMGNFIDKDGYTTALDAKGGAFYVSAGGSLTVRDNSRIEGNRAAYGEAIYLEAHDSNPSSFGHLYLNGSQTAVSGDVYLAGKGDQTAAYVEPDGTYIPSDALEISIENDYNGRPVIRYTDSTEPGESELSYYKFGDAIHALYDIVNRNGEPRTLELSIRKIFYLDGLEGSNSENGLTPETAFLTLEQTFRAIGNDPNTKGVLVYIVNTVEIYDAEEVELLNVKILDGGENSHYEGYYKDSSTGKIPIQGQIFFKRYSKPSGYEAGTAAYEGYGKETLKDSLFYINDGGKLILNGIYLDGHSVATSSANPVLAAAAVEAESPLVTVTGTGVLECRRAEGIANSSPTETLFTNNVNKNNKSNIVGIYDGMSAIEGSSAGIELLEGGSANLEHVRFSNLALGMGVAVGGTDIYNNGNLAFAHEMVFGGTVYLEGQGTETGNRDTSRFLTVKEYGTPAVDNFQVLMRDPYENRVVAEYPLHPSPKPNEEDIGKLLLENVVKDYFYLTNLSDDEGDPDSRILVLKKPVAVYIDGTSGNGNDDPSNRMAGSTPRTPVESLKRAYELLKIRGGNTIYVVNTIQADSNFAAAGTFYKDGTGEVLLGSTDKVQLVRYIQPDFAGLNPAEAVTVKYDVPDFEGALLNVPAGISVQFGANISFDGHSKEWDDIRFPKEMTVTRNGEAKAPLITVEEGGNLDIQSGVTLCNNDNIFDPYSDSGNPVYMHGGAIFNSGTTTVDDTLFANNKAKKGSVVYQDGTFTILGAPEKLIDDQKEDGQNEIYLTTENKGTETNPIWGSTDHELWIAVPIPKDQVFGVDMDRREKGRNVIRFTSNAAYDPSADAEHDHFRLADTVPKELFLVEAVDEPDVLELQNWEILKVEVPTDIYLVVSRNGFHENTTSLMGVMSDSPAGAGLFTAPEYMVKNKGIYDAKVSITGFENRTEEEITDDPNYLMDLADTSAAAAGENDLYLAVKGLDDTDTSGGTGFGTAETSLQPYAGSTVTEEPLVLGTLKSQDSGRFTFIGSVGSGFVDKYMDSTFPVEGASGTEVQKYMDGDSGLVTINARAKYLMKYKVEIVPSRRIP